MAEERKHNYVDQENYKARTAALITTARKRKKLQKKQVAEMMGATERWVWAVEAKRHAISYEYAAMMAEVLECPQLMQMVDSLRSKSCPVCFVTFIDTTAAMKKEYCKVLCTRVDVQRREREYQGRWKDRKVMKANGEIRVFTRRYLDAKKAIDAYCRSCEPEGLCRTEDCPLRAQSPLPLARSATMRIA